MDPLDEALAALTDDDLAALDAACGRTTEELRLAGEHTPAAFFDAVGRLLTRERTRRRLGHPVGAGAALVLHEAMLALDDDDLRLVAADCVASHDHALGSTREDFYGQLYVKAEAEWQFRHPRRDDRRAGGGLLLNHRAEPIPVLLTRLPEADLANLYRGVVASAEGYAALKRGRLTAWYAAFEFCLAHEIIRRSGGDTATGVDVFAMLATEYAHLDIMEQAHLGQNLVTLRDQNATDGSADAAALFAALLAPVRAELDQQYRRS